MKYRHSEQYVINIINNANLTTRDVVVKYHEMYGIWRSYNQVIEELTFCDVDTIRWILRLGKYAE